MTPMGTRIRPTSIPLGRRVRSRIAPTGSGRPVTCRTPVAIALIRADVSRRRSMKAGRRPCASAAWTSRAFALRMSSAPASIASARPCNARSLAAVGTAARSAAAARAAATTAAIARGSVITPGSAPVPPEDDQVVPVHRFLPGHPHALPDSCLAALYDESPQLATAVPHQSDRHLLPTAVGEHHQVAHIELPLDVHDACRQQAASLLEQGRPRPVIDDEVAAGSGGECQPALARPQGLARRTEE